MNGQTHEVGGAEQHVYLASLQGTRYTGRYLRSHECRVVYGFWKFKHEIKITAVRGIIKPGTENSHARPASRHLASYLENGSGLEFS